MEDGRVGGHTNDVLLFDELGQRAGFQAAAGKVIQPDGYSGGGKLGCRRSHNVYLLILVSGLEAREGVFGSGSDGFRGDAELLEEALVVG